MTEANRLAVARYRAAHPERVKEANRAARLRYFRSERGRDAHRAHGLVLTAVRNGVRVRLTDFMGTHDRAKVIDLDAGLFRRICGPLSIGVCEVTVRW